MRDIPAWRPDTPSEECARDRQGVRLFARRQAVDALHAFLIRDRGEVLAAELRLEILAEHPPVVVLRPDLFGSEEGLVRLVGYQERRPRLPIQRCLGEEFLGLFS